MHWIALQWLPDGADNGQQQQQQLPAEALGWWALQFTPRVAWLDEALLLEVAASERLWGGRQGLLRSMAACNPMPGAPLRKAMGTTGLVALARLRLFARGHRPPAEEALPSALPLFTLSAARPHLELLERMGCRTWGDVAALPRGGLARRFGVPLCEALDMASGLAPERHRWLTLPEVFDQKLELPALAETAPELMWSANRLLAALQLWLRARQLGVLALQLEWTLDLKRFNGVDLPPRQSIDVRTAEPAQDMAHLRRLMAERLAVTQLAAPASWLQLRTLKTAPWAGTTASFLPDESRPGDKLHALIERLSARLGAQQVQVPVLQADHRPEAMQAWQPALARPVQLQPQRQRQRAGRKAGSAAASGKVALCAAPAPAGAAAVPVVASAVAVALTSAKSVVSVNSVTSMVSVPLKTSMTTTGRTPRARAGRTQAATATAAAAAASAFLPNADMLPPWLLRQPLRLEMRDGHPWYHGKLRRLVGPQRLEGGWWADADHAGGQPALRDYYIAESPQAGLVWVFRERPSAATAMSSSSNSGIAREPCWYLQGLYA